jgi:hypothetical protein
VQGKWWRPEDLGIVDYSQQSLVNSSNVLEQLMGANTAPGPQPDGRLQSTGGGLKSLYNDQDVLVLTKDVVPLVPGLLDGLDRADLGGARSRSASPVPRRGGRESTEGAHHCHYPALYLLCCAATRLRKAWLLGPIVSTVFNSVLL